MSPRLLRRSSAALTCLALAGTVALVAPLPADAATRYSAYGASAYGSTAKFGDAITLGRTANLPLCTTVTGPVRTNSSAAVTLPGLGSLGATVTKVQRVKSGSTQSTITTSETANVQLGGVPGIAPLLQADKILSEARVTFDGTRYVRTGKSTFVGLRILGVGRSTSFPANTAVALPGVGTVFLNEQSRSDAFDNFTQSVTGLRLAVTTPLPGVGTGQVRVSYASASLHSPKFARAFGNAFATQITGGQVLNSGPSALVDLPCGGTSGQTRRNNVAGVNVPGVLTGGAASTTARSTDSAGTNATTTATIADLNLLGGLLTADAITAKASATRSGTTLTRTSAGTTVVNLRVNGTPVTVGTGVNQRVPVADVGTLYVRRSSLIDNGLQVYALQLVLNQDVGALTAGTVVNIGAAQAGVSAR